MSAEDVLKMRLVMDVQWAMVRLAALSGAAGCIDTLDEEYCDLWRKTRIFFREVMVDCTYK